MAVKGMAVFTHQGEDFTINDPNIADEFSESNGYEIGDHCYYQGNLYRFKQAHAAGAWNSGHVDQVKVGEEIKEEIKKVGDEIKEENRIRNNMVTTMEDNNGVIGYYIDTSGVIVEGYYRGYCYVPYKGGGINITCDNPEGQCIIKFWDESKTTMLGGTGWVSYPYAVFEEAVPDGTKYISVSCFRSDYGNILMYIKELSKIPYVVNGTEQLNKYFFTDLQNAIRGMYINSQGNIQPGNNYAYMYIPYSGGSFEIAGALNSGIVKYWNETKDTMIPGSDVTWSALNRVVLEESIPEAVKYISISCYISDIENIIVYIKQGAEISALKKKQLDELSEVSKRLKQARKATSSEYPITIAHFSDIHGDAAALGRIVGQAGKLSPMVDDIICTGDFVPNSAEQITSWWDENVLLVIGNHDTASYNGGTYDMTALPMEDRVAYYIAPFESNWGITRPTGKSYYYKDYADAKVRMIALDYMTYWKDQSSQESADQTAWLAGLLADAITNNLHVLVAVHGPVFDSEDGPLTLVESQFTRADGDMITSDLLGFAAIIDTVKTAIGNGLHFIGYICGHTHSDNIYKTVDNQIFYCVTCANVAQPSQWAGSDMFRDDTMDAYNLVTINTSRNLIKIVRGGGANMSMHMNPRKTLCVDYSTNTIMGEEK